MHLNRERTAMGDMAMGALEYIWRKAPTPSETRARAPGLRQSSPPFLFWEHRVRHAARTDVPIDAACADAKAAKCVIAGVAACHAPPRAHN